MRFRVVPVLSLTKANFALTDDEKTSSGCFEEE